MAKQVALSALSGCVWAAIAFVLLERPDNVGFIGGAVASPLIGVVMGLASPGFRRRHLLARMAIAALTLYAAVGLFGAAGGAANVMFGEPRTGGVLA